MKKKLVLLGCLLALLSLVPLGLVIAQSGAPIDPYEGNDSYDRAYGPLQSDYQYAAYLDSPSDKDYYYFDLARAGAIQVDLSNVPTDHVTDYNYLLILYGPDGNIVESDQYGTGDKRLVASNAPAGSYHILVEVGEAGGQRITYPLQPYLLRVTTTQGSSQPPAAGSDSFEDNNSFQTAYGPLESGKTYEAYCWAQDDPDYYYITLNSAATIKADLKNVCADCDYDLYLADSAGNEVASSTQGQGLDESLSLANAPAGDYYVIVAPYAGYSQQVPYRLTVTYNESSAGPQGPQPGNEAAWARSHIEAMGYTVLYDPGVMDFDGGSQVVVAIEEPRSFDLRLTDDTTRRQALDTWGVLLTAFDVDALWIGLTYQNRYVVYYAVDSDNFHQFIRGTLSWDDLPVSYGIWDQQAGQWVSDAKDFMDKNFQ